MSLDAQSNKLSFSVLVGCKEIEVKEGAISGVWQSRWQLHYPMDLNRRTIAEKFLRVGEDGASIHSFIKQFGPPEIPFGVESSFTSSIQEFRRHQQFISAVWNSRSQLAEASKRDGVQIAVQGVPFGGFLKIDDRGANLRCVNILDFMRLELLTIPLASLRRCELPECGQRFTSANKREKYCSTECTQKARNRTKLEYWNRNKPEFLKQRAQARKRPKKGKTNVTRKAR